MSLHIYIIACVTSGACNIISPAFVPFEQLFTFVLLSFVKLVGNQLTSC